MHEMAVSRLGSPSLSALWLLMLGGVGVVGVVGSVEEEALEERVWLMETVKTLDVVLDR